MSQAIQKTRYFPVLTINSQLDYFFCLFCQVTSNGLAIKIEEYVPIRTPIRSAVTKGRILTPPKIIMARSTNEVVNEVFIDLETV